MNINIQIKRLKHHLKTMKHMKREKKKQDPITWKTEFLNLRVRDSVSSYFTYKMLMDRQVSKHVFYPCNTTYRELADAVFLKIKDYSL